ncbi:MAG: F0F1 ATP synthase subunit A [Steroidobacter sp.]
MRLALMANEGGEAPESLSGYISHHLHHLSNHEPKGLVDFSVVHLDTIFFSLLCATVVLIVLRIAAVRATSGMPGKFQSFVEMIVEWINGEAKTMVHGDTSYIAPLALLVFCWVTVMNAVDLLPVDWLPSLGEKVAGVPYLRPLPTADLNATLGLAFGVLMLVTYYGIKVKGLGGWLHEFAAGHFGSVKLTINPLTWLAGILLLAANLFFGLEGFLAPTLSHGFRLYGNMYAGELIFFLISGLGASATLTGTILHLLFGTIWAIFHILIVLLQAYVFMMLTLVYIGRAHEHH